MVNGENRLEQIIGMVLLFLLVIGCFVVLRPFVSALLLALILSYATWPIYVWNKRMLKGRQGAAAILMTIMVAAVLLVPLILLGSSLAAQVSQANAWIHGLLSHGPPKPPDWVADIPLVGTQIYQYWAGFADNTEKLNDLSSANFFDDVEAYLLPAGEWLLSAAAILGQATLELALSLFIAFFFYRDGVDGANRLQAVARRLWGENASRLLNLVGATIKSVVYGTIGTAVAQSILTGLGIWLAGVPGALLLAFLTFLMALTPIGAPLVWFPAAIWLFFARSSGWAIFLLLWGILVVGGADNLIRPYFISRGSDLPFVLVFLGVMGGALAFGFLGIFLGPTLLATGYDIIREWARLESPQMDEPSVA